MRINFSKYQGTGNDFIIIDNRKQFFAKTNRDLIAKLCDRRFGIGADGLILLENDAELDFKMIYFNSDGNESSMCGNGGRCIVDFASKLGIIKDKTAFNAIDGKHEARINSDQIELLMQPVHEVAQSEKLFILDTGSPHLVKLVDDIAQLDVKSRGAQIRYSDTFSKDGINVNFVKQLSENSFAIRTYERGVEDETLSCGTGVTAAAIAMYQGDFTTSNEIKLNTRGGELMVRFEKMEYGYDNIYLVGPAKKTFEGNIECQL